MTRIIAGSARGRPLAVPPDGTRPTGDRVREAMFASLDHLLGGFAGARVLDLFAGSGALGLEAASRGAMRVVAVERTRASAQIITANARATGAAGVEVVVKPVATYLAGTPTPFDLVLADPPYAVPALEIETLLAQLVEGWLAPDAVVLVERPTRGGAFRWPPGVVGLRESRYGTTTLWYGSAAPDREER